MKTNSARGKKARKIKPAPRSKQPTSKKAKSIMLTTLAVGAAGILGYLGWQYYRKRKASKEAANTDLKTILQPGTTEAIYPYTDSTATPAYVPPASSSVSSGSKTTTTTSSGFPLKRGSKGSLVKALQQALISKYGVSALPRYGADGDFGTETANALKKAGLPATVDESTYYVLTQGSAGAIDANALAMKLLDAAAKRDFATAMSNLKKLSTKEDYSKVSSVFSQYRLGTVRKTLVNGLLDAFTSEDQKQQIRYEFIRIGLKFDGSKWSLSGFDGRPVVTVEPTNVWLNATESVSVPAMMVLGAEVSRKLDYTLFENNRKYFLVATKSIKYL